MKSYKLIKITSIFFLLYVIFFLFNFSVMANDNTQLEALLQSIIEEKTNIPSSYLFINLGNFFLGQELYQPALEEYQKALEIDPSNTMAVINFSYALFKMGSFEEALSRLTQLTSDKESTYPHAYYLMGVIYREQNEIEKAIEQYEKVIDLIPNHQQVNAELGQLYLDNQQLIEANERFMEMGYAQPRPPIMDKLIAYKVDAYCYLHLGNYYRNNSDLEKAKQAYQQATHFENDQRSIALAYFYQGEINLKEHHYDRAMIEKTLAQKTYPLGDHNFTFNSFAEAFIEIGDAYYHAGNLPEAFKHYELATNMASAEDLLAHAHYKKGLTYYRDQDYQNALREAEIALSLNPDYLSDRERLIDLLIANSWSKITMKK
ncbi:MAG: tetratricopeptide repeat protein [Candidatus Atribacteria bacterium]|nr:tetratricopeptide repeat protein [Candidatus Atribacteria bacterium]